MAFYIFHSLFFSWIIYLNFTCNALLELTLFPPNATGRQCLDGSPAGFYYEAPQYGHSDLWIIYLQGGGICHNKQTCDERANTSSGSSTFWNKTYNGNTVGGGVLSSDPTINPDFYSGHHVFAANCIGDAWTGQRTQPSSNPNTWGYYFSGHLIFEHIIKYLADNLNFVNAAQVLLTGSSAGGAGTFVNIDWLNEQTKQHAVNKSVMVKGAPQAGWFFATNTSDQLDQPLMPPNDFPHWSTNTNGGEGHTDYNIVLYDSYLHPKCVNALTPTNNSWHCGCIGNLYQYIETPIFVMQNKYDTNQIFYQFLMPLPNKEVNNETIGYVEYFGDDTDRSILTQMVDSGQTKNGLFYPSCFDHGSGLGIGNTHNATTIDGYNSSQLVGDWFWERDKLPHIVYDKCNSEKKQLPCNPTCDGYPK